MKIDTVGPQDLSRSVLAVPPLARSASLALDRAQNARIIRHLEAGGVTTLMYGGNANLYNLSAGEMPELATMLAELVAALVEANLAAYRRTLARQGGNFRP